MGSRMPNAVQSILVILTVVMTLYPDHLFGVRGVNLQSFERPFFYHSGRPYQAIICLFLYWLGWILQNRSGILFG